MRGARSVPGAAAVGGGGSCPCAAVLKGCGGGRDTGRDRRIRMDGHTDTAHKHTRTDGQGHTRTTRQTEAQAPAERDRHVHSKTHAHVLRARQTKGQADIQRHTQMHTQMHRQGEAETQKGADRNGPSGETESGRHTDTNTHPQITPAGLSLSVPADALGNPCCTPGLKLSWGAGPSPSPPVGTVLPMAAWCLRRMGLWAVEVQGRCRGVDMPGGGGAQDRDSSPVQPCCWGQTGEDFPSRFFARNRKSHFSFCPVHASGLCLSSGRVLLGVPRAAQLTRRGTSPHTPPGQAPCPGTWHPRAEPAKRRVGSV